MGFFGKDINCDNCGAKTNLFTRRKFVDEKAICGNCASIFPNWLDFKALEEWTYSEYESFRDYVKYSEENLRPKFNKTHEYEKVLLDYDNGIFCIVDNLFREVKKETIFFEVKNIIACDFDFNPKEFNEGIFSDSVEGKTAFGFSLLIPMISAEMIMESDAKGKAKKSLLGTRITYENPKKMAKFEEAFLESIYIHMQKKIDELEKEKKELDDLIELDTALALFMFDSLEGIGLKELKAQRDRLIKAFHTDNDENVSPEFATKINLAYSILKKNLNK